MHVRASNCIFQSVLFTEFFDQVEKGQIKPGQTEHDRPAQYLLKKSVELLQPLGVKIEERSRRYDELLKTAPPKMRKDLNKELPWVKGMVKSFEAIERDLLDVLADPQGFRPTRDKACFLLFVHAMLADTADQTQGLMDAVDPAVQVPYLSWYMRKPEEETLIKSYLTEEETRSNLFSPDPLTPARGC